MKEFIKIFDRDKEEFLLDFQAQDLSLKIIKDCLYLGNMARYTFYDYIQMNDIYDEKIYAECSIVELDFKGVEYEEKLIGYFKYDNEALGYRFYNIKDEREFGMMWYEMRKVCSNLRIVDTLQENKLGLISKKN